MVPLLRGSPGSSCPTECVAEWIQRHQSTSQTPHAFSTGSICGHMSVHIQEASKYYSEMLQILLRYSFPPSAHGIRQEARTMEMTKRLKFYT